MQKRKPLLLQRLSADFNLATAAVVAATVVAATAVTAAAAVAAEETAFTAAAH